MSCSLPEKPSGARLFKWSLITGEAKLAYGALSTVIRGRLYASSKPGNSCFNISTNSISHLESNVIVETNVTFNSVLVLPSVDDSVVSPVKLTITVRLTSSLCMYASLFCIAIIRFRYVFYHIRKSQIFQTKTLNSYPECTDFMNISFTGVFMYSAC